MMMQRHLENLMVLKQLKTNPAVTDMALLKQYTGWGGLREMIYNPRFYQDLKKILQPAEILSLKKTFNSAYYTPTPLIEIITQAIVQMGWQGKRILEPAAGIGSFLQYLPDSENKEIVAIEIDSLSSAILRKLYPTVNVKTMGFEQFHEGNFDLVIGNPPYGSERVKDDLNPDLAHLAIHHHFVAKSMRLLKTGGLLAMVLPCYFLDNYTHHARIIIAKEGGHLLAAFRMPEDLFADAKVTVDIVFLRKEEKPDMSWINTKRVCVDGNYFGLNEYYHAHPTHILGKLAATKVYDRFQLTCRRTHHPYAILSSYFKKFFL